MSGAEDLFNGLSREVRLRCGPDGRLSWLDGCATRLLGAIQGTELKKLVAPGTEAKLDQLLRKASAGAVDDWEVTLLSQGVPKVFSFCARADGSDVILLGCLLADGQGGALEQAAQSLNDISELQRTAERQKRELKERYEELRRIHSELEDSNRGVVNLYAELDEKADSLRRTNEVKSRIVANVSHEFRTPINSIAGLARILLAGGDGPLNDEQRKQVGFMLKSADELSLLVTDLLDLAKLESGTLRLRTGKFEVPQLFGALRGTLRPLLINEDVTLLFEDVDELPVPDTDETKIAQILRNLISNSLKFTERGEVRVKCFQRREGFLTFTVQDTGIGIAPGDLERIFEEFTQLESSLQKKVKGTGLGLSLSRRLAELLGGSLTVQSTLGAGSTFTFEVPLVHPEVSEMTEMVLRGENLEAGRAPILVVEDDRQTLFLYEKYLVGSGFQVVPARTTDDARAALKRIRPAAVVLDIMLDGEASWGFLSELKDDPATRDIPVLVVTVTDREQKARALGADEFWMKPMDQAWLLRRLSTIARPGQPVERVLVIDDDQVSRYLVRKLLTNTSYEVIEAEGGAQGVDLARQRKPHVILLDFVMPGMGAFEVLDELKKDPVTRNIPVIIHTSKNLDEEERKRLAEATTAILNKQSLSREIAMARIREALINAGVGPPRGGV